NRRGPPRRTARGSRSGRRRRSCVTPGGLGDCGGHLRMHGVVFLDRLRGQKPAAFWVHGVPQRPKQSAELLAHLQQLRRGGDQAGVGYCLLKFRVVPVSEDVVSVATAMHGGDGSEMALGEDKTTLAI